MSSPKKFLESVVRFNVSLLEVGSQSVVSQESVRSLIETKFGELIWIDLQIVT